MLNQVAEGVFTHGSEFIQSNAVIVQGPTGVLLIDAGVTADEMAGIAHDLRDLTQTVVAGFSTHAHWDHLLWSAKFGAAPRYGTARSAADIHAFLSNPDWQDEIAEELPPEIEVPLDLLGQITGLPAGATHMPWDGPPIRIIEHRAHAAGHASLVISGGVLVPGDMLSDVLVPMLDFSAADPIEDYLNGLKLLESVADDIAVFVPGHGSVGGADELHARIELDRAYVRALPSGGVLDDPRLGRSAQSGWDWVSDVHAGQVRHFSRL
jgi:glyoxylase-like metal-dependent hydrolase (beta-lactamase superfamily II)